MIHGILQFTLSIAFRYVLHRNKSRDIRCRESFPRTTEKSATKLNRGGHPPTTNVRPRGKRRKNAREKEKQRCLTPSRGEARTEDNLPPAPRPRKKGGNVWDSDREGLGWPPRELALLLALPRHQPTTIPPFLRRARDRKEENRVENKAQASQAPCLRQKGGIEGDDDREGRGWPPRELALRFVLPEHQSTTIPPFLRKARGHEEEGKRTTREKGIYQPWLPAHKGRRLQTENKLPQPRAFKQKGGTAGDDDREGLGWPPWELSLLFVLPEHQSTTIPPFLRKARGRKKGRKQHERKRERYQTRPPAHRGRLKQGTSFPAPVPSQKGGELQGTAIEKD
jgi:hypothetical protein